MKTGTLISLLLTALLATTGTASAAPPRVDLRGTWSCVIEEGDCRFTVKTMNMTTGAFTGDGQGNSFPFKVAGDLDALKLTLTFDFEAAGPQTSTARGTVDAGNSRMTGTLDYGGAIPSAQFNWARLGDATPEPAIGRTVVVGDAGGTIRFQAPGSRRFVTLGKDRAIPTGSVIDATRGVVELTSAASAKGVDQTARFNGGVFKVSQTRTSPITTAELTGDISGCGTLRRPPRTFSSSAFATAKRKPKARRLFGSGKGRFRTIGNYGAATVRGTKWSVQDGCGTTTLKVTVGSVEFRDFALRKNVVVAAGQSYTARAR